MNKNLASYFLAISSNDNSLALTRYLYLVLAFSVSLLLSCYVSLGYLI